MEKKLEQIAIRLEIGPRLKRSRKTPLQAERTSLYAPMLRVIDFLSPSGFSDPLVTGVKEVIREAQSKSVSPDLVWLALFLNSRGTSWAADEKAKQMRFLSICSFNFLKEDEERLMELRNELTEDLAPLIEPDEFTEPRDQLTKLLQKINAMGLQTRWHLEPADANWKLVAGENVITRGRWTSPLGYGKGVLKFRNEKFTVRHAFDDRYAEELVEREGIVRAGRKCFYAAIVSALEDGTFLKLRRCQECRKFFITGRLGKKYCHKGCMLAADHERAVQTRVPNFRARERAGIRKITGRGAKRRTSRRV